MHFVVKRHRQVEQWDDYAAHELRLDSEGSVVGVYSAEVDAKIACLKDLDRRLDRYNPDLHVVDDERDTWTETEDDYYMSIDAWENNRFVGTQRLDFDAWFKREIVLTPLSARETAVKLEEWSAAITSGILPDELEPRFRNGEFVRYDDDKSEYPVKLSTAMRLFLGIDDCTSISRTRVTQRINQYIKDAGLQSKRDRRIIMPNEKLKDLLGPPVEGRPDVLTYFTLQSRIKHHFLGIQTRAD